MAEVDFSNARIEPYGSQNVTADADLSLSSGNLYNSENGPVVISGSSVTRLINQQKQLMYIYRGTFSASGTEFYIFTGSPDRKWKVSNISFSSGDTYVFQINATLVCN